MIKCQVVVEAMDRLAPRYLAENWDNVGLLIGNPAQEITKILTCLDVTEKVIDKAICENYNMIISHHPFLFKGIKKKLLLISLLAECSKKFSVTILLSLLLIQI